MPQRPQTANILPHRFTPERARAAALRSIAPRVKAVRLRILKRAIAGQKVDRTSITGTKALALIVDSQERVSQISSEVAELRSELRARLDAKPSRAEYIQAGVERHLGRALLPSPQVLKRRKKLTQTPAPLAPGTIEQAPADEHPGFDPTAKPQPRRALGRPPAPA